jgi:hypothetical protein
LSGYQELNPNWDRSDSVSQGSDSSYADRKHVLSCITAMEKRLSIIFGLLIGGMWMGEILLGNLGGTSVFGNLRDVHPRVYALAGWFAVGAVAITGIGGAVTAYRTGRISAALRVGVWSGLLSGAIVFVTLMIMIMLFHEALMKDSSNIHEFARTAHRVPTEAELSNFLYRDALGGALNHLWIGPLLGLTVGAVGAIFGKWQHDQECTRLR